MSTQVNEDLRINKGNASATPPSNPDNTDVLAYILEMFNEFFATRLQGIYIDLKRQNYTNKALDNNLNNLGLIHLEGMRKSDYKFHTTQTCTLRVDYHGATPSAPAPAVAPWSHCTNNDHFQCTMWTGVDGYNECHAWYRHDRYGKMEIDQDKLQSILIGNEQLNGESQFMLNKNQLLCNISQEQEATAGADTQSSATASSSITNFLQLISTISQLTGLKR